MVLLKHYTGDLFCLTFPSLFTPVFSGDLHKPQKLETKHKNIVPVSEHKVLVTIPNVELE